MRFFNTTGPVVPTDHYCLPPLERLNFNEVRTLIHDKRYFVLHAPRQTGKTSALLALRGLLNSGAEGDYRCVYINVEVGQAAREDVPRAMRATHRAPRDAPGPVGGQAARGPGAARRRAAAERRGRAGVHGA